MRELEVFVAHEAERALLGATLIHPEQALEVVERVGMDPDAFALPEHQALYRAILKQHPTVTASGLLDALRHTGDLDRTVTAAYIAELTRVPSCLPERDAKAVHAAWTRRRADALLRELAVANRDPEVPVEQLLDRLGQGAFGLVEGRLAESSTVADAASRLVAEWEEVARNPETPPDAVSFGLDELDKIAQMRRGELVILAARPSVGKTALMLQVALNAALNGIPVLFCSAEMDEGGITSRMFQALGGRPDDARLRWRTTAQGELEAARKAARTIADLPIELDSTPNPTLAHVATQARRFARKHPRGLIIIDYLQLLRSGRRFPSRVDEVGELSRTLKQVARDTRMPVLVGCQLSRAAETETSGYRLLAYLRESGSIEQDSDIVLVLRRLTDGELKALGNSGRQGLVHLTVAKHRNGRTGELALHFDGESQTFSDPKACASPARVGPRPTIEGIEDSYLDDDDELF